jgi:arylesterase/paraoxonase
MKKGIIIVIGLFGAFVLYTLVSGGFFREIVSQHIGSISQSLLVSGAEDIAISRKDEFLIVSSDDRASRRDGAPMQGGLYYINLKLPFYSLRLISQSFLKPLYPHGISLLPLDSGKYQLLVINHVGDEHTIERFLLVGEELTHIETLSDPSMISPNDVVAISENEFYFTNDHQFRKGFMRVLEDYLGLSLSGVVFSDGEKYADVAGGIAYANGINYDATRKLMYVASPRDFQLNVYNRSEDNSLTLIEEIATGTGVDNIEFDEEGNLWIGCHPSLLQFAKYAKGNAEAAPSEIIKISYQDVDNYTVESVFVDDGAIIKASTVAVPYKNQVFIGSVFDDKLVVWDR